jgi:hypothetical protein
MGTIISEGTITDRELKILKREKWRKIFPSATVSLFLFLIVFIYSSIEDKFGLVFISLSILSILIGTIIFQFAVRNYNKDLKNKKVNLIQESVEDKVYKLDYEPGSATVPINLFSLLFFKQIFQREMKEVHIYYIVLQGEKIFIEENDFNKVFKDKPIVIRQTVNSNIFLGIETF